MHTKDLDAPLQGIPFERRVCADGSTYGMNERIILGRNEETKPRPFVYVRIFALTEWGDKTVSEVVRFKALQPKTNICPFGSRVLVKLFLLGLE